MGIRDVEMTCSNSRI